MVSDIASGLLKNVWVLSAPNSQQLWQDFSAKKQFWRGLQALQQAGDSASQNQ